MFGSYCGCRTGDLVHNLPHWTSEMRTAHFTSEDTEAHKDELLYTFKQPGSGRGGTVASPQGVPERSFQTDSGAAHYEYSGWVAAPAVCEDWTGLRHSLLAPSPWRTACVSYITSPTAWTPRCPPAIANWSTTLATPTLRSPPPAASATGETR